MHAFSHPFPRMLIASNKKDNFFPISNSKMVRLHIWFFTAFSHCVLTLFSPRKFIAACCVFGDKFKQTDIKNARSNQTCKWSLWKVSKIDHLLRFPVALISLKTYNAQVLPFQLLNIIEWNDVNGKIFILRKKTECFRC